MRLLRLLAITVLVLWVMPKSASAEAITVAPVLISSLKSSGTSEAVEITNNTLIAVDVEGWKLEYSNVSGSNIRTLASLSGTIAPGSYMLFASSAFASTYGLNDPSAYSPLLYTGLADSGGFVRLYKPVVGVGYEVVDEVGWLSSSSTSESTVVVNYSGSTKSLHRCVDQEGLYVDRGDNRLDFYVLDTPLVLTSGALCADLIPEPEPEPEPEEEVPPPPVLNTCTSLLLNEVLPNPTGTDNGQEFIELYNPTEEIMAVGGCMVSYESKTYTFPDQAEIGAKEFLVLSDTESGITLTNSKQGAVYLIGQNGVESHVINYASDLDDNQSWILLDGVEYPSYQPTPGAQNVYLQYLPCDPGYERSAETGRCNLIPVTTVSGVSTCDPGYERNPETNRCRKVTNASLGACGPGQERNPTTNRCRTIVNSQLSPCDEGEERNPDTNRCRKIDIVTELVPCGPGQERNPETNRCRELPAVLGSVDRVVEDSTPVGQPPVFPMELVVFGITGYAFYEWKDELRRLLQRLKSKISR